MVIIALIGTYLIEEFIIMDNNLYINFNKDLIEKNVTRLINQLWKLIPMRENNEDWKKQLNTVIIEIAGLGEVLNQDPQFL